MFPLSDHYLHTSHSLLSSQAADESSEEASFYEILPCCARFRCGEVIAEGQWHHLVLVMSKGMLKNSMATLYIDGQLINTVKVRLWAWLVVKRLENPLRLDTRAGNSVLLTTDSAQPR